MAYVCPYGCQIRFPSEDELGRHGILVHPGKPILQDSATLTSWTFPYNQLDLQQHDPEKRELQQSVKIATSLKDDIQFCLEVILKEAKEEETLAKQVVYGMLSAYSNNPINLAINAPTGTGKTHTIMRVVNLFPKNDVVLFAGMTDKALFHRQGILVTRKESGEYQSLEPDLEALDQEIEAKDMEISGAPSGEKPNLKKERAALQKERAELLRDAKKLIDLSHKVIVFLDTPSTSLFAAMMPLLSHDAWEVEYDFVDTHNGIKTRSNVLRGWPAVIFAQAIDSSRHPRWPEIQRRFIVTNTKQSDSKIEAAIELTADKYGLPDTLYQQKVVSDADKDLARMKIGDIKHRMLDATKICKPGKNNVFVPFRKTIEKCLPRVDPLDMTTANRFFAWLSLMTVIRSDKRPLLVMEQQQVTAPIATFEDLKEALSLVEYANGVRPYVLDWFNKVFLAKYADKQQASTNSDDNEGEQQDGISTKELAEWIKYKEGKRVSREYLRQNYCDPLYNTGYLDKEKNQRDNREVLYSPVKEKQGRLFDGNKITVKDYALYPDRANLVKWIRETIGDADILTPADGNTADVTTPEELVEKYYGDPSECFSSQYQKRLDQALF